MSDLLAFETDSFPGLELLSTNARNCELTKGDALEEFKRLRIEISRLQRVLYAENQQSLLVVFQAMDAGGKDGTIRKVFQGVNPQGVHVASFKRPTELELEHDFLWRIHPHTPAKGMISVFNRSHYEDVLVPLVESLTTREVIEARYEHIRSFERMLMDHGTKVLKFFLNISNAEQKRRLNERLTNPDKRWKFEPQDLEKRTDWKQYMSAFAVMFEETSTPEAPWHIIPSDDKWYRNLLVARIIFNTLESMSPEYPKPKYDLTNIVIE